MSIKHRGVIRTLIMLSSLAVMSASLVEANRISQHLRCSATQQFKGRHSLSRGLDNESFMR